MTLAHQFVKLEFIQIFWQINFVPLKLLAVQFLKIILFRLIGEATMNVIRGNTKPMDVIKLEVSMYTCNVMLISNIRRILF